MFERQTSIGVPVLQKSVLILPAPSLRLILIVISMLLAAGIGVYWSALPFEDGAVRRSIPGAPGVKAAFLPLPPGSDPLTIGEVARRDGDFIPMPLPEGAGDINLRTGGERWFRFDFDHSHVREKRKILDLIWRGYDWVTLYEPQPDGSWREAVTGQEVPTTHPFYSPRWRAFELTLSPDKALRVYLHVQDFYRLPTQFQLWSDPNAFIRWEEALYMRMAGYYSIWFATLVYGLFLYAMLREKAQADYLRFMVALGLLTMISNGIFSGWMPVHFPVGEALKLLLATMAFFSLCGFARHFLETVLFHPALDRWLLGLKRLVGWSLLLAPLAFWPPASLYYLQGFLLMAVVVLGSLLWAAFVRWRAGFSLACFFVLAFCPYLVFLLYRMLYARDEMLRDDEQRVWFMVSNTLMFIFLSLASGYRYRQMLEKNIALQNDYSRDLQRQVDKQTNGLKQAGEELREAVADRERVMALIGHDLRGPAITLFSLAQILNSDAASLSREELGELTTEIVQACELQLELLNNLLMWGSARTGQWVMKPQVCRLSEVVSSVCLLSQGAIEAKGLTLICELPDDQVLCVDRQALETMLRNLLSNAVKFTSPGGQIVLKVKQTSGEMLTFCLSDTGAPCRLGRRADHQYPGDDGRKGDWDRARPLPRSGAVAGWRVAARKPGGRGDEGLSHRAALPRQPTDDFSRGDKPEGAGDIGSRSVAAGAIHPEIALRLFPVQADGPFRRREALRFGGEDGRDGFEIVVFPLKIAPQLASHLSQQRVATGERERSATDLRRVEPSPRTADGEHGKGAFSGTGEQEAFDRHPVDGVDDPVVARCQKAFAGAFEEKLRHRVDFDARVDAAHPFGQCDDFGSPDLPFQRGELPVGVGDADVVLINQGQPTDPGAGEGFHRPGADASHADDGDMSPGEAMKRRLSIKACNSSKTIQIDSVHFRQIRKHALGRDGSGHRFVVETFEPGDGALLLKLGPDGAGGVVAHAEDGFGVAGHLEERCGEGFVVALGDEEAAGPVLDGFGDAAVVRCRDGEAGRHRFEHGVGDPFLVVVGGGFARVKKEVRAGVEFVELALVQEPGEADRFGDAKLGGKLLEFFAHRSLAREGVGCVGEGAVKNGEGF